MRNAQSDFPVGAEWVIEDKKDGRRGRIWLHGRDKSCEIWYVSWCYSDGSSPFPSSEWFPSYRLAREWLLIDGRMKRIK